MKGRRLLFLLVVCLATGCSEKVVIDVKPDILEAVLTKPDLKVLDIGNSYTEDATRMLPFVIESTEVDLKDFALYKAVRGGASFRTWCDVYENNDKEPYSISKVVGDLTLPVVSGTGNPYDGHLFRETLQSTTWDIVLIHTLSTFAPYYNMWNETGIAGGLDDLLAIIRTHQPEALIGFEIVPSYASNSPANTEHSSFERWSLIAQSAQQLCREYDIQLIIPYGTAVQNLRASSLNNEYDLTRDGTHCGYGLCSYVAACSYYESLIRPRTKISVLGKNGSYRVPDNWRNTQSHMDITQKNVELAQLAAISSVHNPFICINPENLL